MGLFSALLFASGLTKDEITIVDRSEFVETLHTSGLLTASRKFLVRLVSKLLWLLWKLFAPYVLVRQILAVFILQISHEAVLPLIRRGIQSLLPKKDKKVDDAANKKILELQKEMSTAETYDEWRESARALESVRNEKKHDDSVVKTSRVQRMNLKTSLYKRLVEINDAEELEYRLRSELQRKHWGLGSTDDATTREHPKYRAALHEYLDAVCAALALIAKGKPNNHNSSTLLLESKDTLTDQNFREELEGKITYLRTRADFFSETLHSFGRTALMLSGGARLGLIHLGVVKALVDQKLLPRVISGSSAGSIVAVMLGACKDEELEERLFTPANLNLKFFSVVNDEEHKKSTEARKNPFLSMLLLLPPPFPFLFHGLSQVIPNWFSTGTLLDVNILAKAIRDATGDLTFKEAFERTGRIINITVSPSGDNDFPMLLNYITAPRVLIWSASVASCAIPGVFAPVELMAKDMNGNIVPYYYEGLKWADGSVESDLPMQRLSELFNINHFVVSQVNPHARFLAPMARKAHGKREEMTFFGRVTDVMDETVKVVVNFCRDQSRSSVKHLASAMLLLSPVFPLFAPLKLLGRSVVPILTQKYTGDITIMPPMTMKGMLTILSNPTHEDFLDDIHRGERVTWPHISRLRLHVAIEFLLEDCRQSCRRQLGRLEQQLLELGRMETTNNNFAATRRTIRDSISSPPQELYKQTTPQQRPQTGIPTASVLNLNDLDISSEYRQPPPRQVTNSNPSSHHPQTTMHTTSLAMRKNNSFSGLSDKLKSRVQSFAADLSSMGNFSQQEEEEVGNGGGALLDGVEEEEEEEEEEPFAAGTQ